MINDRFWHRPARKLTSWFDRQADNWTLQQYKVI